MSSVLRSLTDGFRWWMIPALLLLLGGILGLGAIPMQAQTRMAFFGNDQ